MCAGTDHVARQHDIAATKAGSDKPRFGAPPEGAGKSRSAEKGGRGAGGGKGKDDQKGKGRGGDGKKGGRDPGGPGERIAITAAVPLLPIAQGNGVRVQIVAEFAASLGTITLIPDAVPEKGLTSRKRKRRRSQPPNPRRRVREVAEAARTKTIMLWGKRIPTLITF